MSLKDCHLPIEISSCAQRLTASSLNPLNRFEIWTALKSVFITPVYLRTITSGENVSDKADSEIGSIQISGKNITNDHKWCLKILMDYSCNRLWT